MRKNLKRISGIVGLCAAVLGATPSFAEEENYIARFSGTWAGKGTAIIDAHPIPVNCKVNGGAAGANRISVSGDCSAAVIFGQPISVDLTFDPASGLYKGTYVGDRVGPAKVSGKRKGNVVNFIITWPKPVNGDTRADMKIENTGSGVLRITVTDNQVPGGQYMQSSFVLSQL
jgi:hypothetical protein